MLQTDDEQEYNIKTAYQLTKTIEFSKILYERYSKNGRNWMSELSKTSRKVSGGGGRGRRGVIKCYVWAVGCDKVVEGMGWERWNMKYLLICKNYTDVGKVKFHPKELQS